MTLALAISTLADAPLATLPTVVEGLSDGELAVVLAALEEARSTLRRLESAAAKELRYRAEGVGA